MQIAQGEPGWNGAAGHHRFVGNLADRGLGVRRHRHVDDELAQEFAVAVEHLDAVVAAIGDIDIAVGVGRDRMRGVELAGLLAAVAPRFQPVAVLVDLGDARIDIAVADEGVAGLVPGHVGDLAKPAVLGGQRRLRMLERLGVFVGGFLLAAEHHDDAALGIELDHHVRALVGHPDIVLGIDLDGVAERPGVEVLADFADELALGVEFQQLRRRRRIGRPAGVAARQHENMALGIDRDAGYFAEIHVGRQPQRIGDGVEGDDGHILLRQTPAIPPATASPTSQCFMIILPRAFVLLLSLKQMLVYGTCCRPSLRGMSGVMTVHRPAHGLVTSGLCHGVRS